MSELRPGNVTLCVLALLVATSAYGQTIRVVDPDGQASATSCGDSTPAMTTIGAAISAAAPGDTILVCPGTYVENINFGGKAITVQSVAGPAVTVIDGNGAGSVVTFTTGETAASVLQGFTIRNGQTNTGGGLLISGASPVIRGNVITGNRACQAMGMSISSGSPLIEDNTIANNIQYGCSGGTVGGGIYIGGTSSAVVRHNRIYNNLGVYIGGGIALNSAGTPTIELNLISGNGAQEGGGIGMINDSDPTIADNIIIGNQADQGGGIYWLVPFGSRGPLVVNNTIAGNNSASGSGIYADGNEINTPVVNNVIVASGGQTAIYCGNLNNVYPPILQYNDVFSAAGTAYGGICGDMTGANGNISADPQFVDPVRGDYHLLTGSAAIDAGSNSAAELPSTDFDGRARIIDGNGDGLAVVDMGAYETSPAGVAPGTFAKLAPTNTATGQPLVVTLTWQPSAGATAYEFCYDTVNNGTCDGTWIPAWNATSVTVPALGGATYYWQVRATNEGGVTYADGSSAALSSFTTAVPSLRRSISLTGNLAFGGVLTGISVTRTVTITNSGNGTLTVTGILCPPGFSANYAGGIPSGGSQVVTVTFTPAATMSYSGTLLVVSDETDGAATAPVSGTGLTASPVMMSSLVVDKPSPLNSGTPVTFTATASGGNGNLQYEFWRYRISTGQWTLAQAYGSSNHYTWYPVDADADTYDFQVWVRSSGSQALYDGWLGIGPIQLQVPTATVTSLSCNPAGPVDIGTSFNCYANASGGTAIDYSFWLYTGGSWTLLQDYSPSPHVTWIASAAGIDNVQVWVRSHTSTATYQDWRGTSVQVLSRPLSLSQVTSNVSLPAPAGTYLSWSVTATGGTVPTQFQWWLYSAAAGSWTLLCDYSPQSICYWRPMVPGNYNIEVWARSANSTAPYDAWTSTGTFAITSNVVKFVSLVSDPTVPVTTGTTVWSAQATGGFGSLQYEFWIYDASTGWSLLQAYSYANYVMWTPTHPGTYEVQVWVRDSGSTAPYDAWLSSGMFQVR